MNREQIEEIRLCLNRLVIGKDLVGAGNALADIEALCNMALNSIPKAFDPEDKTTWPEVNTNCLVWGDRVLLGARIKDTFRAYWGCDKDWYNLTGAGVIENVTHFLPIPEVGEE